MIERFILPKRLANPAKSRVCVSCRNPFERAHNPLETHTRFQKHVHVIRHNDPSRQTVSPKLDATNESSLNISGNFRVLQPKRPTPRPIKPRIENEKSFAGIIPLFLYPIQDRAGKRPKQSPSNKNTFPRRMPVRQVPFVVAHLAANAFLPEQAFTLNISRVKLGPSALPPIAPFGLRRVAVTSPPKRRWYIAPSSTVIPGCAPFAKLH